MTYPQQPGPQQPQAPQQPPYQAPMVLSGSSGSAASPPAYQYPQG